MSTIFTRSAIRFWSGRDPGNIACIIDGRIVTLDEQREKEKRRQRQRLERIREVEPVFRPCFVWVAYFDQALMGGWQAFVKDNHSWRAWIDRDRKWLIEPLMKLVPLGHLFFDWEDWKPAFAKAFQHGRHDRKPRGRILLEWNGSEIRKRGAA